MLHKGKLFIVLMVALTLSGCSIIEDEHFTKDDELYTSLSEIIIHKYGSLTISGEVETSKGIPMKIDWAYFGDLEIFNTSKKPAETLFEYNGDKLAGIVHNGDQGMLQNTKFYYNAYGLDSVITLNSEVTNNELPRMIKDWFYYDDTGNLRYIVRYAEWVSSFRYYALVSREFYFGADTDKPNYFFIDSVDFQKPVIIDRHEGAGILKIL